MTNNNDNRIELIGLNEFIQVTDAVKELAEDQGWDCFKEEADHNNESFKKGRMK